MLPVVLSHVPHALVWAGLCLLTPTVLGLVLYFFAEDEPRNQEADDEDQDQADMQIAA